MKRTTLALAALALLLAGSPAGANTITWGGAQNISGAADVLTNGTLVGAFNVGGAGVGSAVINGVTFAPFVLSGASSTSGDFTFAIAGSFAANNGVGSALVPFAALPPGYQTMLESTAGDFNPFTLTMSALTIGTSYEFEWWTNSSNGFVAQTSATAGNSVTLSTNTTGTAGGLGQFAVGTFIADATSQVITFNTVSVEDQLNGFQLRQLGAAPVPEPATLTLLGIGLAGLVRSRQRKR